MTENKINGNSISILDVILVLVKNKLMIFLITFITFVLILGISIVSLVIPAESPFNLLPDIFQSSAKILISLPGDTDKLSVAAGSGEVGTLLGVLGAGSLSQNVGKFIRDLVELNEIRDKIINEFHFIEKYNIQQYPITIARELFQEKIFIEVNSEETIVTIGFEDTDPIFATNVLNRIIEEVVSKYNEITRSSVNRKKITLEGSVKLTEENYKRLQDKFITFSKEHGIVDIAFQTRQSIELLSSLKADLAQKEMELIRLLEYYTENDPKVVRKKKDIETAKQIIAEAEKGIGIYSNQFLPRDVIPELTKEYLNLELELNIQAAIYKMLREQYEAVRVEELNTSDPFQVLEAAEVPEKKIRPSRVFVCLIFTIAAFFLSILVAFIREYLKYSKRDPGENEKLSDIRSQLSIFKFFKRKR